jgi:dienelactone hydrolase
VTEIVLFHHAQGLTDGVRAFAEELRQSGHIVTLPDLYGGRTFTDLNEAVAYAQQEVGIEKIVELGEAAVAEAALPEAVVYAGFSLGAMPAQKLAQTRRGALGAIIYHGGVPASAFGSDWPATVALQIHVQEQDEWTELDVVQALAADAVDGELFTYPGSAHLVTDNSLDEYDAEITSAVLIRTLSFLDRRAQTVHRGLVLD